MLAAEFGPAGPYALLTLVCLAGQQGYTGGAAGVAKTTYRRFVTTTALRDPEQARVILARLAELALIEFSEDEHGHAFEARLCEWLDWGPKDPGAAERSQRYRDKKEAERDASREVEGEQELERERESDSSATSEDLF